MSGRLNFKRDETSSQGQNSTKVASNEKKRSTTSCRFILPVRFLKNIREKVAKALLFAAKKRRTPPDADPSTRRSNPSVAPSDTHRVEAIKECIEFINASSSLWRSKSVSNTAS